MKKRLLERFIQKYYLNGIINSAVWIKENETLRVSATPPSTKLIACVKLKDFYGFDNTEFGVLLSDRLLKMLKSIPVEDVKFEVVKNKKRGDVEALIFSTKKSKVQYVTNALGKMPAVAKIKRVPPWDFSIILDNEFKQWFVGSYNSIKTDDTLITFLVSEQTGKFEVVLNYHKNTTTDSAYFHPATSDNKDVVIDTPLNFNAKCLKEILKANPEFKELTLEVSNQGIASIACSEMDLDSQYYLIRIDTED